jgi:hypothetical protein
MRRMSRISRRNTAALALFTVISTTFAAGCGGTGAFEEPSSGAVSGSSSTGSGSGGTGGSGGEGGSSSGSGGDGGGSAACASTWDAAPPTEKYGPKVGWNHGAPSSFALHRGRDLVLNPGDKQWALGKFSYGLNDNDLEDERVDIYLLRECSEEWELLGSELTTDDDFFGNGPHAEVEGVEDDGGRVYYEIPASKKLGVGRHRIHFVVRGDLTATDQLIEVVPPGTPFYLSDVDGTLTISETAEFPALLSGELPETHADASAALAVLAKKGYHPMYVTARPDFLLQRTREFLDAHGFPRGIVHTTMSTTGANGDAAVEYKTGELATLAGRGVTPVYVFGNTETDAEAYDNAGIKPLDHRIFYQFTDEVFGGRRIEEYTELLTEFEALAPVGP